jgi:protein-disulfide isomerase
MTLLQKKPHPKDHYIGELNALVVLVEYGDYECAQSAKSSKWIEPLQKEFKNNLCYVYRHFPMGLLHPHAVLAATAAESASLWNKFWDMHKLLFDNHHNLSLETILQISRKLKLNNLIKKNNIKKNMISHHILRDILSGLNSGVVSTPAQFINGIRLEGPMSLERIFFAIENTLKGTGIPA